MIRLLVDAAVAAVILTDRALCAVENALDLRPSPRAVDGGAQPADADASATAGVGGHPIRTTSELLTHAHDVIVDVFELDKNGGYGPCFMLVRELRDRAADFAAHGD